MLPRTRAARPTLWSVLTGFAAMQQCLVYNVKWNFILGVLLLAVRFQQVQLSQDPIKLS